MSYSLGVDLGTTFVAAAVAHDSQVEMFTLGDRSVVSPSAVYVREDGTMITGDAAVRQAVAKPDRVGREFKRRLGDPIPVILGGVAHSVTNLLGAVLRDVVAVVRDTEGAPPASIVLTHPANWGPFRRELFDEVPELAGLTGADAVPLRTVTEPEGAAAPRATSSPATTWAAAPSTRPSCASRATASRSWARRRGSSGSAGSTSTRRSWRTSTSRPAAR